MQKFAPNLAETTTPLQDLIKKDNEFVWDDQVHGQCLSEIKQTLTQASFLTRQAHYYDRNSKELKPLYRPET